MTPFLTGFLGNLSAIRAKQLLRILSQMRDRGEIRTHAEFEEKLTDLAKLVQSGDLEQQTPSLTFSEGDLMESDAANHFMDFARLDTEAMLGEVEHMSNAIRAHRRILSGNYFDTLEAAVDELEATVTAYEVLEARKFTGFSRVVCKWNFSGSIAVAGSDPDDPSVSALHTDLRGQRTLAYAPPVIGEPGLRLAVNENSLQTPSYFDSIELLTDSTTPQTEFSTSTDEDSPIKAIDGDPDTAWRHAVLLSEHPDTCRLKLGLTFSGARRVNALVMDGLADVPMKVVSVEYLDSGGREGIVDVGTSSSSTRSGHLGTYTPPTSNWAVKNMRRVVPTGDLIVQKIILTLQQDTGIDGEFFYNGEIGSWQRDYEFEEVLEWLDSGDGSEMGIDLSKDLGFREDLFDRPRARFAEYPFGLKDINTIEREYHPDCLFVPEPVTVPTAPRVLALYTDAEYPSGESTDIEFLLRKENFDADGVLSHVETIPFLPYGTTDIDERLFLTRRQDNLVLKDVGVLRFYPDFSEGFTVYSGSRALTIGSDYEISVDGGATWEIITPPTGTPGVPMRCWVKILSPQTNAVFRVEYSPLVSSQESGGEVWLNAERTVRLGRFQTYVFSNERTSTASCKLCLQIITRANTLNTRVSPYLKEVVLLSG